VREVRVLGVGATPFVGAGRSPAQLAREALTAALADAGLAPSQVRSVVVAAGGDDERAGLDALAHARLLVPGQRSSVTALHLAWDAVASGARDLVVCVGHASGTGDGSPPIAALATAAAGYMGTSGATERHFALVAAKDRLHGAGNPRAMCSAPVDADTVLRSKVLAWPLHALMVAERSQGAAAIVLAGRDRATRRKGQRGPRLRACVLVRPDEGHEALHAARARAARLGYRWADLGPEDVDCAEIDDPTAAGELAAYEALQLAPEGQGPDLAESGFTALGGVLPVNTSGGALALGYATGAAAIAQVCELTWQLRGEADRRQVAGARVGLALAGGPDGDGADPHVGLAVLTR
jgi:acetyl-CoA acetyltransferase